MNLHLTVAGRTDLGRVRKTNEDSFVVADLTGGNLLDSTQPIARFDVGERGVLLAVSDGMGGHKAGEVASALAVESVTRSLAHAPPSAAGEQVKEAVHSANRVVREAAHEAGREGMGATLTALYVQGTAAYIAEVGDSRAYLVRAGELMQLTHDQSYVQLLLDTGAIDPAEAVESPLRNVLVQAIGQKQVSVELGRLELRDRDCLVLCSDGLNKHVTDDEIRRVVLESPGLDAACSRLVDLANERGGEDNTTVIVAGVGGGELPPSSVHEGVNGTFKVLEPFSAKKP